MSLLWGQSQPMTKLPLSGVCTTRRCGKLSGELAKATPVNGREWERSPNTATVSPLWSGLLG